MASSRQPKCQRKRVGQVSYYRHHGAYHIYYREAGKPVRRRVADDEATAAQIAAQVNAQLAVSAPTPFSFVPITVSDLRKQFLDHHEYVVRSSLATVRRYRSATQHLENFAAPRGNQAIAHQVDADAFARFLRSVRIAPNGHSHARRRPLRDKGVRFVLETCRSMYAYAAKRRHLPPYSENPFAGLGGKRFKIEDSKRIFVFDANSEAAFFRAGNVWGLPIHFTLAKTGLRSGELVHLLIEDLDLDAGWMRIRNKPELGWKVKTRRERDIPLIDELVSVLWCVIGSRKAGPVFLRQKFDPTGANLAEKDLTALVGHFDKRISMAESQANDLLPREHVARIARKTWRDAGAVSADAIRLSFLRTTSSIGLANATCPKSWRHTFATLLQDAGVDPLIRQITLGHAPCGGAEGALGMTTVYTHTRRETQKCEIERALRLWPTSLAIAQRWSQGGASCR